jgi:hypothetical protein
VLRGRAVRLAASAERLAVRASTEVHGRSPPPSWNRRTFMVQPAPVPPHDDPGERGQVPAIWLEPSPVRTKPCSIPPKRPALRALYCNRRATSVGACLLVETDGGAESVSTGEARPYRDRVRLVTRRVRARSRRSPPIPDPRDAAFGHRSQAASADDRRHDRPPALGLPPSRSS